MLSPDPLKMRMLLDIMNDCVNRRDSLQRNQLFSPDPLETRILLDIMTDYINRQDSLHLNQLSDCDCRVIIVCKCLIAFTDCFNQRELLHRNCFYTKA